ncbi:hypothetical protein FOMPIDRAFT_1047984 [Fomitopsis schrenkii]|uniref:Uncharacterized protein n=1 Tax=Fomitopsis schrenkii TaxID=2126942 RepID=S8EBH7_FOMSC|nr:hypothetical protein FOMPIDRAFT_1047984 [Fomitopsis schrenkii]
MYEYPSTPRAESEPYTGCPYCTPYWENLDSLEELRPLPHDAVLAVDPGCIDWNNYYWGYDYLGGNRIERRSIVRPLPRSITDRIPLELFERILGFLQYEMEDLYNWQHLSVLACCTSLSTVLLRAEANPMDSWQGLVTAFREILYRLSSPAIRTIRVEISMQAPKDSPSVSAHPDSEFWTIDLGVVHDLMKRPLFKALQDVNIHVSLSYPTTRLTCDAVLTEEAMERRVRLILEPWDKRGILTVRGRSEPTDEELRQENAMHRRESEEEGASGEDLMNRRDVHAPGRYEIAGTPPLCSPIYIDIRARQRD